MTLEQWVNSANPQLVRNGVAFAGMVEGSNLDDDAGKKITSDALGYLLDGDRPHLAGLKATDDQLGQVMVTVTVDGVPTQMTLGEYIEQSGGLSTSSRSSRPESTAKTTASVEVVGAGGGTGLIPITRTDGTVSYIPANSPLAWLASPEATQWFQDNPKEIRVPATVINSWIAKNDASETSPPASSGAVFVDGDGNPLTAMEATEKYGQLAPGQTIAEYAAQHSLKMTVYTASQSGVTGVTGEPPIQGAGVATTVEFSIGIASLPYGLWDPGTVVTLDMAAEMGRPDLVGMTLKSRGDAGPGGVTRVQFEGVSTADKEDDKYIPPVKFNTTLTDLPLGLWDEGTVVTAEMAFKMRRPELTGMVLTGRSEAQHGWVSVEFQNALPIEPTTESPSPSQTPLSQAPLSQAPTNQASSLDYVPPKGGPLAFLVSPEGARWFAENPDARRVPPEVINDWAVNQGLEPPMAVVAPSQSASVSPDDESPLSVEPVAADIPYFVDVDGNTFTAAEAASQFGLVAVGQTVAEYATQHGLGVTAAGKSLENVAGEPSPASPGAAGSGEIRVVEFSIGIASLPYGLWDPGTVVTLDMAAEMGRPDLVGMTLKSRGDAGPGGVTRVQFEGVSTADKEDDKYIPPVKFNTTLTDLPLGLWDEGTVVTAEMAFKMRRPELTGMVLTGRSEAQHGWVSVEFQNPEQLVAGDGGDAETSTPTVTDAPPGKVAIPRSDGSVFYVDADSPLVWLTSSEGAKWFQDNPDARRVPKEVIEESNNRNLGETADSGVIPETFTAPETTAPQILAAPDTDVFINAEGNGLTAADAAQQYGLARPGQTISEYAAQHGLSIAAGGLAYADVTAQALPARGATEPNYQDAVEFWNARHDVPKPPAEDSSGEYIEGSHRLIDEWQSGNNDAAIKLAEAAIASGRPIPDWLHVKGQYGSVAILGGATTLTELAERLSQWRDSEYEREERANRRDRRDAKQAGGDTDEPNKPLTVVSTDSNGNTHIRTEEGSLVYNSSGERVMTTNAEGREIPAVEGTPSTLTEALGAVSEGANVEVLNVDHNAAGSIPGTDYVYQPGKGFIPPTPVATLAPETGVPETGVPDTITRQEYERWVLSEAEARGLDVAEGDIDTLARQVNVRVAAEQQEYERWVLSEAEARGLDVAEGDIDTLARQVNVRVAAEQQEYERWVLSEAEARGLDVAEGDIDTLARQVNVRVAAEQQEYERWVLSEAEARGLDVAEGDIDTLARQVNVRVAAEQQEYERWVLSEAEARGLDVAEGDIDTLARQVNVRVAAEQQEYEKNIQKYGQQISDLADRYDIDTEGKTTEQIVVEITLEIEKEQEQYRQKVRDDAARYSIDTEGKTTEQIVAEVGPEIEREQEQSVRAFVIRVLGADAVQEAGGRITPELVAEARGALDREAAESVDVAVEKLTDGATAERKFEILTPEGYLRTVTESELGEYGLSAPGAEGESITLSEAVKTASGGNAVIVKEQEPRALKTLYERAVEEAIGITFGRHALHASAGFEPGTGIAIQGIVGGPDTQFTAGDLASDTGALSQISEKDREELLHKYNNPLTNPYTRTAVIILASGATMPLAGLVPNLAIGAGLGGADLAGTRLQQGKLTQADYVRAGLWELVPFVPGAVRGVGRGIVKGHDIVQAVGTGSRLSDIAVFQGSQNIPFQIRNLVPPRPQLFAKPNLNFVVDVEHGAGRRMPGGAIKTPVDPDVRLVQSRPYEFVESARPESVPTPGNAPYFDRAITEPNYQGGIMTPGDSQRQVFDTIGADYAATGQAGPRTFTVVDAQGKTKILEVDFQPSELAKVISERTGVGPQFHSSPAMGKIVGDPTTDLSMLGDIGAGHAILRSDEVGTVTGRTGDVYDYELPIKMPKADQPLELPEQGGFMSPGVGIQSYTQKQAFGSAEVTGDIGLTAVDPRSNPVYTSPSRAKNWGEFETFTPIGEPWRAGRVIPESEASAIKQRANEYHPNDPGKAALVAEAEIRTRTFGGRRDVPNAYLTKDSTGPIGDTRPSATAMVFDPNQRAILMVQGGYGKNRKGKWQSPGGLIDGGEDGAMAALRETTEETGVSGKQSVKVDQDRSVNHEVWAVEYRKGTPAVQDHETLAVKWVPFDDVKNLDLAFPETERLALNNLRNYLDHGREPVLRVTRSPYAEANLRGELKNNGFADILPHSVPEAQRIPVGIGTRLKGPPGEGAISPQYYHTFPEPLTPGDVRRANLRALPRFAKDPFGRYRVARPKLDEFQKQRTHDLSFRRTVYTPEEYASALKTGETTRPVQHYGPRPVAGGSVDLPTAKQRSSRVDYYDGEGDPIRFEIPTTSRAGIPDAGRLATQRRRREEEEEDERKRVRNSRELTKGVLRTGGLYEPDDGYNPQRSDPRRGDGYRGALTPRTPYRGIGETPPRTPPGTPTGTTPRTLLGTSPETPPGTPTGTTPRTLLGTSPETPPGTPPGTPPRTPLGTLPETPPGTPTGTTPRTPPGTPTGTTPRTLLGTSPETPPRTPLGTPPGTPTGTTPRTPPGTPTGTTPRTLLGTSPETPPRTPPGTPPRTPPGTPPRTPPRTPPGTPPRTPPGTPPRTPPRTPPGTPPRTPPRTPPGTPPRTPPRTPPGTPPRTPPRTPPGTPPRTPPRTPPGTPPRTPPETPPRTPPETPPRTPPPPPPPRILPRGTSIAAPLRPILPGGGKPEVVEKGDGKFVTRGKYRALTEVNLDFHTGESTANLVELSPVDLTFTSEVPPPARLLATRNLDFGLQEGPVPRVTYKARREQIISDKGSTYGNLAQRATVREGAKNS